MLRNPQITLGIKRKAIYGLLGPKVMYGVALYGHTIEAMRGVTRIMNRAVAQATGKRNASLVRAREEMKIPDTALTALYFRVKSLVAWRSAAIGAGELIATRKDFRADRKGARRDTWSKKVAISMARAESTGKIPRARLKGK